MKILEVISYVMRNLVDDSDSETPKVRTTRWTANKKVKQADGKEIEVLHIFYQDAPPDTNADYEGHYNLQESGYWDHAKNIPVIPESDDIPYEVIDNRVAPGT